MNLRSLTAASLLLLAAGCASAPLPGTPLIVRSSSSAVSSSAAPTTFTFTGVLQMHLSDTTGTAGCAGKGGYDDIKEGALVTIYDETGKVIQTGILPTGSSEGGYCNWHISIPSVPNDAKFYQVEISHRGKITVSAADAKAGNFGASLGSG